MKKFLISAALVAAVAAPAVAQNEYAPEKGEFSVELQFNPFSRHSRLTRSKAAISSPTKTPSASVSVSAFTQKKPQLTPTTLRTSGQRTAKATSRTTPATSAHSSPTSA